MIGQGQKEVCVDTNHKSQKKLKKAHSITQDTNIKATHLLMLMEQLVNSDAGHKSVPARGWGMSPTYHQSLQTGQPQDQRHVRRRCKRNAGMRNKEINSEDLVQISKYRS